MSLNRPGFVSLSLKVWIGWQTKQCSWDTGLSDLTQSKEHFEVTGGEKKKKRNEEIDESPWKFLSFFPSALWACHSEFLSSCRIGNVLATSAWRLPFVMFDVFKLGLYWRTLSQREERVPPVGELPLPEGTQRGGVSRVRFIPSVIKHPVAAVKRGLNCNQPSVYNAAFNEEQCCTFYVSTRINKVLSDPSNKRFEQTERGTNVWSVAAVIAPNKMIETIFDGVLKLNPKSLKHRDPPLAHGTLSGFYSW